MPKYHVQASRATQQPASWLDSSAYWDIPGWNLPLCSCFIKLCVLPCYRSIYTSSYGVPLLGQVSTPINPACIVLADRRRGIIILPTPIHLSTRAYASFLSWIHLWIRCLYRKATGLCSMSFRRCWEDLLFLHEFEFVLYPYAFATCTLMLFYKNPIPRRLLRAVLGVEIAAPLAPLSTCLLILCSAASAVILFRLESIRPQLLSMSRSESLHLFFSCDFDEILAASVFSFSTRLQSFSVRDEYRDYRQPLPSQLIKLI